MATLVVNSSTADGDIRSASGTYSTARDGGGTLTANATADNGVVGQIFSAGTYTCAEMFLSFDTSSIPDAAVIQQVDLTLHLVSDGSTTDFEVQARAYDWGSSLGSGGNFRTAAQLSALTLLASLTTSGIGSDFTLAENGSEFRNAINKSGSTRLVLCSSRHVAGTTPSGAERIFIQSSDSAVAVFRPQLTVTYTDAVAATGALATVTVAGYAGAAAVEIDASGALATVDVAGKDATLGLGTMGALASVDVEGLAGVIASGAEGQGQAAAITVVGLAGTYGLGTLGAVASVTVGGFAGAATFVVSAAGALATVAVQSFAGLAIRAGGSGRQRPGAGRFVSPRSPSGTFQSMKSGVGRFFGPRGGMGR